MKHLTAPGPGRVEQATNRGRLFCHLLPHSSHDRPHVCSPARPQQTPETRGTAATAGQPAQQRRVHPACACPAEGTASQPPSATTARVVNSASMSAMIRHTRAHRHQRQRHTGNGSVARRQPARSPRAATGQKGLRCAPGARCAGG
jgi:hypothetical protein